MPVQLPLLLLLLPAGAIADIAPNVGRMHPMHTAVVEITYQPVSRLAAIQIRVFRDDFGATIARAPNATPIDSAMARYVRGAFHLTDRAGRTLPLRWDGAEQSGDVMVLRLSAPAPEGLHGAQVLSALLCDRFEDQVNIVRAAYEGHTRTLLFTRGDGAKSLP
jgi:hypothetical protein